MNKFFKPFSQQLKLMLYFGGALYALAIGAFLFLLYLQKRYFISVGIFTRDPLAVVVDATYVNPFIGAISNVGILFWAFTVAIAFFGAAIIGASKPDLSRFLYVSGIMTAWLMLDDLFMFHEMIAPHFFKLPELAIMGAYGAISLIYIYMVRKMILKTNPILFGGAMLFFGLSIFFDDIFILQEYYFFVEDGFKLLGIITWFLFFTSTVYQELKIKNE